MVAVKQAVSRQISCPIEPDTPSRLSSLTQKHIAANPIAGVSIRVPKKGINREDGKAFSSAEQQVILTAALAINDTSESPSKRLVAGCHGSAPIAGRGSVKLHS
jgi:hypothetical protein